MSLSQLNQNNFIAIGGCPRSGTTALVDLLNLSGSVFITRELRIFRCWNFPIGPKILNHKLHPGRGPAKVFKQHQLDFQQFRKSKASGRDIAKYVTNKTDLIFGDKLPRYYLYGIRVLAKRFPNMKFIICLRDGRAIIASQIRIYKKGKSIASFIAENIPKAEPLWIRACENIKYHLSQPYSNRIHIVRYEDAVTDTPKLFVDLRNFLKIDIPYPLGHNYKPTNLDSWKTELPNMMDRISPRFKELLEEFGYE